MSNQTSTEINPPNRRKNLAGRSVFVFGVSVGLLTNIGLAIAAMVQVFPLPISSSVALLAPLLLGLAFLLAAFFAAGILIGGPFLLFSRAQRRSALGAVLAAVKFFMCAYLVSVIVPVVRNDAFQRLAERSGELVAAIHRYYDEQGQPPATLD